MIEVEHKKGLSRLKLRAVFIVILGLAAVAGGFWFANRKPAGTNVRIELRSDPFPLSVGWGTLKLAVVDDAGSVIPDARVTVLSQMMHPGMLPYDQQAQPNANGEYEVSINWPMAGQWTVDVDAEVPGVEQSIQDHFDIFVYPVPVDTDSTLTSFRSASEIDALVSDPAREFSIVIPQGAQALIRSGEAEDMIPTEIRLNVSGRNTLVIQNNDIVDHSVGPFLVRSGEVIRQKYNSPTVYQGVCSLNVAASISIIVEE